MEDKRFTVLQAMKDHYDGLFARVHYLFIAHGAGLVGCLTVLKDYATTPQYRGVGIPTTLFGLGLISTIVTYVTTSISRTLANNAVLDKKQHEPSMFVYMALGAVLRLDRTAQEQTKARTKQTAFRKGS
jgi:hypothetical protein